MSCQSIGPRRGGTVTQGKWLSLGTTVQFSMLLTLPKHCHKPADVKDWRPHACGKWRARPDYGRGRDWSRSSPWSRPRNRSWYGPDHGRTAWRVCSNRTVRHICVSSDELGKDGGKRLWLCYVGGRVFMGMGSLSLLRSKARQLGH